MSIAEYLFPDIEQKRQRSNYLWSRIRSESSSKATISALQQPHALPAIDSVTQQQSAIACVPIVRITLRSEDKTDEKKLTHAPVSYAQVNTFNDLQVTTGGSESASDPRVLLSTDKKSSSSKLIPRPRKFHLTSSATSSMSACVVPEDEVQKSKKRRRDLAVFVEKRKRISPFDHDSCRATNPELRNNPTGNTQDVDGFRKFESKHCPLNGGIDKEESNKRPKDPTSMITKFPEVAQDRSKPLSQSNFGSIALTEQLHQATPQDSLIHIKTLEIPLHKPQPKIKPKPPRPRLRETQLISTNSDVDEAMVDGHFVEDDEDFIYDTYVRSSNQMAAISIDPSEPFYNLSDHMPDQIDINKIGILIIAEEDQAVWETFGEEEESDKDWNSEEEDENGTLSATIRQTYYHIC